MDEEDDAEVADSEGCAARVIDDDDSGTDADGVVDDCNNETDKDVDKDVNYQTDNEKILLILISS